MPLQPTMKSGKHRKLPQWGPGMESQPILNFVQSECQRSYHVAHIALNFHSKRLSLIFKKILLIIQVYKLLEFMNDFHHIHTGVCYTKQKHGGDSKKQTNK